MGFWENSKDAVWKQLADELGAVFIMGSFTGSSRIEKPHRNWKIVLDTYTVSTGKSTVTYTRMRVPYVRSNDVLFKLSRKNIFSGLGNLFGMPVVGTYDYDFDDEFVIKGNDEPVLREIFANDKIKDMIRKQKRLALGIRNYRGKANSDESELYFQTGGVVKDPEKLKNLFGLFSLFLDELAKNGVASDRMPSTVLYKEKG
ncbi:MAG: DUF3137 domain-containing protein [Clostridia bacterium]|nr:DUF3137 domain-containing protein [Clostridia bacterium]